MTALLVYNVEPASTSMIRQLDGHCRYRNPDGTSAIDPARSHLNRILVGSDLGIYDSLELLYESGVKRPTKQAEKPFLRIVVSASPEYFRPDDPTAAGTWDPERLEVWLEATMAQLRAEHGDDLVYAELHLDEDTPHIHAVVAPTYQKKPRRPGRQKRGETPEEFAARKAAAETETGERVVGRASHPELSKKGSFQRLRERMAVALDHLGIEYGEDRHGQADAKTTRQWVKEQAAEIRKKQKELDDQKSEIDQHRAKIIEEAKAEAVRIKAEAQAEAEKVKAETEAEAGRIRTHSRAVIEAVGALAMEVSEGTIKRRTDAKIIARAPDLLRPGYPEIRPAVIAAADLVTSIATARAALEAERAAIEQERSQLRELAAKLREAIGKALRFARRPGTPIFDQVEAEKMRKSAADL